MTETCRQCGDDFERLARHWNLSSACSYPVMDKRQEQVATGILMGDGCLYIREKENPVLTCVSVRKSYLKYLRKIFPKLSREVSVSREKTGSARTAYQWRLRSNPNLSRFRERFYNGSGGKVWPKDLELTPTVLKHWYSGDGGYHYSDSESQIIGISIYSERENKRKIENYFEEKGLPRPSYYHEGTHQCKAMWTVEESKELLDYMGKPVPGFEYKWRRSKSAA